MAKRSREESFSPAADTPSTTTSTCTEDADDVDSDRPAKIHALTDAPALRPAAMQCSLAPHRHPIDFPSVEAFELHYAKDHTNRCSSCDKNFPSAHLLALHIDENHNPLRAELQAKGEKTYQCFVEGCERKCSTPQKRRLHLIDKHLYPKVYHFRIVDTGIDKSASMLREAPPQRRRVSTATSPADAMTRHRRTLSLNTSDTHDPAPSVSGKSKQSDAAKPKADDRSNNQSRPTPARRPSQRTEAVAEDPMDSIVNSMSALQFVPPSVSRRKGHK